jgi:hypothetical protein
MKRMIGNFEIVASSNLDYEHMTTEVIFGNVQILRFDIEDSGEMKVEVLGGPPSGRHRVADLIEAIECAQRLLRERT